MRAPTLALLSVLSVASVFSPSAAADDGWSLTTADFKRQSVNLRSFDDQGARVIPMGRADETLVPLDTLLQLDRGGSAVQQVRGAWTLHLTTGDRVGGEPVAVANDALAWKSPAAGDLSIPLAQLRGIVKGGDAAAQQPQFDPNRTEDVVFLANGDTLKGILTAVEAGKVSVKQAAGDVLPVDLAAVKSIHFAAAKADAPAGRAFRVQLTDGSVVTAPRISLKGDKLTLALGGQQGGQGGDRPIDLAQVVLIEQLNGPVSWLSARQPAEVVSHAMSDTISYPPQMDRDYDQQKIKFGQREFARGIGVHAYTKITYALDGNFKVLRTQYALADNAHKARVTVRILLDDTVVHEARDFTPGKLSPVLLIDLGQAKTLALECHPGGDPASPDPVTWRPDVQARLNWIEPALLKKKPVAEPPNPAPAQTPAPATKPTTTPTTTKPETPKAESPANQTPNSDTPKPESPATPDPTPKS
jgi:hypothetical protein